MASKSTRPPYNTPCTPHSTTSTCRGTSSTATTPTSSSSVRVHTAPGSILIHSQGPKEASSERESQCHIRHRRGRSLGGMWAERFAPCNQPKSAPTSPQYASSSKVLPLDAADVTEGLEREDEGEGLVAGMRVMKPDLNSDNRCFLGALSLRAGGGGIGRKGYWS